ncbi:MAG: Gfo/Idh/MocA family oxidoreductase [Verrucomicrobia bacterium]|nr:Gfo/Idh/MocA family oxidoreductase [Verrucomicrobiota bacterium]MBV8485685.1 Gfo/Idh/MocA family oxidoreductase [Verrucomicrobiota bacterium]
MRIGIAGTGTMGEVHAAAWSTIGVELAGCISSNPTQAKAFGQRHKIRTFANYDELLNNVDIVDICTPTATHKPLVLTAAKAGKHVICEKPIALTVEDGQAMIDACQGVRFFIGLVLRFFSHYRSAKQLVAAGRIGKPGVLRLRRVSYVPQNPEAWYFNDALSGGMVVDLMIHDFDYVRWLAGQVQRVFALKTQADSGAAQYVQVVLRLKSGAIALIEGGWAYPPGVFRTGFDLSGTDGLIEWSSDQPPPLVTFFTPKLEETASVGLPTSGLADDPFAAELRHAYQCIQTGAPFEVTAEDALEALRISLAVKESLETGKPVKLP